MKVIITAINSILTTRRNCLEFDFELILGNRLIVNRNKYDWETFNTTKIKAVFYSIWFTDSDYGTKIRFKCHQRIQRKTRTLKDELCMNWELIDSFGVRLDDRVHATHVYENFYRYPLGWNEGEKVLYNFNICKKMSFDTL